MKSNSIEWKDVKDIYTGFTGQKQAIVGVFTMTPTRRIGDYTEMKYVEGEYKEDKKYNYLWKNQEELFFIYNNYKTSKYLGRQIFPVPDKLGKILLSLDRYKDDFLFQQIHTGKPFQQTYMSKYLKTLLFKATGKNISMNDLRHSIITHRINRVNVSVKDREDLASMMGHGVRQQLEYIRLV